MPTSHPRHSITETPDLAAVLRPLRERLGDEAPTLGELVKRGAEATLRELDARATARERSLATVMDRMRAGPKPDLEETDRIRHQNRHPDR